jgi:hypothetical protein
MRYKSPTLAPCGQPGGDVAAGWYIRRMTMAERADTQGMERASADTSPVAWLLLVPVLLVLWPPLFNAVRPTLFGIPFFYWYQLAVIPIGVLCTGIVYWATTHRGGRS